MYLVLSEYNMLVQYDNLNDKYQCNNVIHIHALDYGEHIANRLFTYSCRFKRKEEESVVQVARQATVVI